ncbi:MAG: hypothetical protein LH660_22090 [Phormidesmis sp. CAN_BIN36]|nr:hypothetical protein [Phormidesmis sp. CAN_BIN36]
MLIATLLSCGMTSAATATGLPLQVGMYRMGASNYIQIAVKGDRLCYNGFSSRGSAVGSIAPDPKFQDVYRINGLDNLVLYQQDIKTLLYGEVNQMNAYEADYGTARTIGTTLQQCLDSNSPFFKREGVSPLPLRSPLFKGQNPLPR